MSVLVVRVQPDEVDECSDWLFQLGARAIEDRTDDPEPTLVAGFENDDAALAARSRLVARWPCRLESTGDEADWRDEWLKWIEPIEVAGFVIHAPWHDPATWESSMATVSIDPGRAFGSGHHPTTRLTLEAMRRFVERGASVLDVGCGTGILSIAASKLGAGQVVGIDLDHDIIDVADANVEANGLDRSVQLLTEPIGQLRDTFDVVVANIVIGDLAPLMTPIVKQCSGLVIVSGFLHEQFERLLGDVDVDIIASTSLDGWGCAVLAPIN